MLTTLKQRAYPTSEQETLLNEWDGIVRAVHNAALQERRENYLAYKRHGVAQGFINYVSQANQLPAIKREVEWVRAVPAVVLQQMLMDLDKDCRKHGSLKVKYWAKDRHDPSYRYPDPGDTPVEALNRKWGRVYLPKLGWLKFRRTRNSLGVLRRVTVKRGGSVWDIAFLYETGAEPPAPRAWTPDQSAGGDLGVANSLVLVDESGQGVGFDRAFVTPGETQRLTRLLRQQAKRRRVNKQWRASKRYQRTQQQIRNLYARQRRRRRDFHDQVAALLTTVYPHVSHEALNIKAMTRSAKGTIESPGVNVTQKRGLNRAILAKGWGIFLRLLEWHAVKRGATIQSAPAHYSSQECPLCSHVAKDNRESQAVFHCQACGLKTHADLVGAWNTRQRGVKLAATPGNPHTGADPAGSVGRQAASGNTGDDTRRVSLGVGGDSALAGSVKRQPLARYTYLV
jgi:putative transposase